MRPERDPSSGRFKKNGGRDSRANSKRWREAIDGAAMKCVVEIEGNLIIVTVI